MKKTKKDELIQHGQIMSNVLYNLNQSSNISEEWRKILEGLQLRWDEIRDKND